MQKQARNSLNNTLYLGRPLQLDFAQLDDKYSALKFARSLDAPAAAVAGTTATASTGAKRSLDDTADACSASAAKHPADSGAAREAAPKKKAKSSEGATAAAAAAAAPAAPKKVISKKQAKNQVKIYNKLLASYGQKKELGEALKSFARMQRRGLTPTVFTYSSMVNACVRCGETARAEALVAEMRARGVAPNEVTYTALMKGLCGEGRLAEAVAMLKECPAPNLRTYHTLLRGAVREADGEVCETRRCGRGWAFD
jgi:pentatricopeptide repeat protein